MDNMTPRRWLAWKLVQLASRICDVTFYERITIKDAAGNPVIEWEISSNPYGDGVMSQFGSDRFGDYTASWGEFEPDWLTDPAST